MTLRRYLILMTLGTILCWIAWVFILFNINPAEADSLGFFYLSLFLATVGTFSVLGFTVRRAIIKNDEIIFRHVRHTFRQGVFLSLLLIITLFLSARDLFNWLIGLLLILVFIGLEGVVFTTRKFNSIR